MSWDLLQRFFDSEVFNQNPFLSVSYLTYACRPLPRPVEMSSRQNNPPSSPYGATALFCRRMLT